MRPVLLVPILLFLLTLPLPGVAEIEVYDGFQRPRWQIQIEGSNPVIRENNKRLEVLLPADSMDSPAIGGFGGSHTSVCRLRGDFDLRVNYVLLEFPEFNGVRVGLGVAVPGSPFSLPWWSAPVSAHMTCFLSVKCI